ncbi:O-antigen ligase domain-containing protein [Flavobacteriaceae bacterium R38]|nr:O-antigen ligase domain-containing protein [Flavobacteriaceae bacterium R38]
MIHLLFGGLIFFLPVFSKFLSFFSIGIALLYILKFKNRNNEVLLACAYFVGSDVLLRMTGGLFFYELTKYLLILFLFLGFLYKQMSSKNIIYIFYILLLIPGIFIASYTYKYNIDLRKSIAFNLSGPVSLGVMALYCYDRRVSFYFVNKILFFFLLPILSMTAYLFLYTPNLQDVITGTQSNFAASGGFGPNQVSTILGIGMFVLSVRFLIFSPSVFWKFINGGLFILVSFRALLTFSRGGVLTAVVAILFFTIMVYYISRGVTRKQLIRTITISLFSIVAVWLYSVYISNGLIENRYRNRNAAGVEKEDITTGRTDLLNSELQAFYENPFFGIGVGNNRFYRQDTTGIESATHNEISRILAEHGTFGIIAFLILFFTPIYRFFVFKKNVFFFSFFLFWFLTINHSAMRIAAPAFIYGLSLLTITSEKNTIHRKQIRG